MSNHDKAETIPLMIGDMINFMKNVALVGAAMIAASHPEPWPVAPAA